jgi:DNA-(apurinic or apyrimidinic site) lyase
LILFIKQSKNNKRFIDTKVKRLDKLKDFIDLYIVNQEKYYDNVLNLRDDLAKTMKQNKDAKTIVFAVKMFSY